MTRDPFDTWAKFVVYFRLVLIAVFLPMMVFGAIAFSEIRPVAVIAVLVLSYFLYRDLRTIRHRRQPR